MNYRKGASFVCICACAKVIRSWMAVCGVKVSYTWQSSAVSDGTSVCERERDAYG